MQWLFMQHVSDIYLMVFTALLHAICLYDAFLLNFDGAFCFHALS